MECRACLEIALGKMKNCIFLKKQSKHLKQQASLFFWYPKHKTGISIFGGEGHSD